MRNPARYGPYRHLSAQDGWRLGCTGDVVSDAATIDEVVAEIAATDQVVVR